MFDQPRDLYKKKEALKFTKEMNKFRYRRNALWTSPTSCRHTVDHLSRRRWTCNRKRWIGERVVDAAGTSRYLVQLAVSLPFCEIM
jgi:hypothetical protein